MLSRILKDRKRYPKHKHSFLVGMLEKFEFCYSFGDADNPNFLLPELLPKSAEKWIEMDDPLRFRY